MKTITLIILLIFCAYSFDAELVFRNPTSVPVTFEIIPGDLYEATNAGEYVQNVIADEYKSIIVQPYETKRVHIKMKCIDIDRPSPSAGHQIRPTIFWTDPDDVDERIKDIIDNKPREG